MSDDKINQALDGKLVGTELTEFESSMTDIQKREYDAAKASRKRRQDEDAKYETRKKERETLEAKDRSESEAKQTARKAEIAKAKDKFIADNKITDATEIASIEGQFSKLDSGKSVASEIISDFESAYASLHKDDLFKSRREREEMEIEAAKVATRNGGNGGAPANFVPPKEFDPHVDDFAKKWGVTREQAQSSIDRQKKDGTHSAWRNLM